MSSYNILFTNMIICDILYLPLDGKGGTECEIVSILMYMAIMHYFLIH